MSAFDPAARVRCVDAGYALAACGDDLAGRGLPGAGGTYQALLHQVNAGVGLDF